MQHSVCSDFDSNGWLQQCQVDTGSTCTTQESFFVDAAIATFKGVDGVRPPKAETTGGGWLGAGFADYHCDQADFKSGQAIDFTVDPAVPGRYRVSVRYSVNLEAGGGHKLGHWS